MMPMLLISKNRRKTEACIADLIAEHSFHPSSIFYYRKNPNLITIDQIREIKSLLINSFSHRRLFVVYDFDSAKKETQNAFLKTLEETSVKADFVLVVSELGQILPTVVSRCIIRKLKPKDKIKIPFKDVFDFLDQSLRQLFLEYIVADREQAIKRCDQFLLVCRQGLKTLYDDNVLSVIKMIKEIIKTRNLIVKNNLNAQIAVDHLLITMKNHFLLTKGG